MAILTPDIEPYIIDADEEVNISIASLDATVTELYIDDVLTASTATDLLEYTWSTSDADSIPSSLLPVMAATK